LSLGREKLMKVTQEKLPDSQISLEIEIPAETSKNTYEKVVQNLARSTNIPGFRKGKIPRQILLQRLGVERVKAVAVEEMIQKSLEAALEQEEITSLGNYKLRSDFDELVKGFEPGSPLIFAASVDVPPTVELGDYQALEISAEEKVYDPQSVEDWLEDRREEMANLIPVEDRAAAMGDVAIVDYQGKYSEGDGSVIPGVEGTYLRVDMSEGRFIEGMVEGIVGMTLDETRDIPLVFPDDYPREDVAGKAVTFTVTLKELKAKQLPDLDDDFAQEASNNEHETLEALRDSLDKRFSEEASKATQENIEAALASKLVKICRVDLPETLVEQEVTQVLMQTAAQMEQLGIDVRSLFTQDNLKELRSNARPEAITRLSRKLIIAEIAKQEALEVESEAVKERMAEVLKQVNPQEIDFGKLSAVVQEEILTEKTLTWLRERAQVTLTPPAPETATSEEE
jgi:trigger factor